MPCMYFKSRGDRQCKCFGDVPADDEWKLYLTWMLNGVYAVSCKSWAPFIDG